MIAAIYARKSTEQHVTEDQKSVTRQIELAREYAVRKGWTVDDGHIYKDDGISGAEFDKRPGYRRLMAALTPRPPFQVLVMMEEARLGREGLETAAAFKTIMCAGVQVFFYPDDRELALGTFSDNTMMFLRAEFAAEERRKASQRTAEAMARKAGAGHVTGGRCFGYDLVDVMPDGRRITRPPDRKRRDPEAAHVARVIKEAEKPVVLRIFTLKADGLGQGRIARLLNEEGALSPRPQQGRRPGWTISSVRGVLFNPLYRGEIVWNRTKKRDDWGQKHVTDRPPDEWKRREAPELRIVPEALWQAAHARIDEARALYQDATKGLRGGRRPRIDSKYLLPGLARCAVCNGGLFVQSSNHGSGDRRRRVFAYACTTNRTRGAAICPNNVRMPMTQVDIAVLAALREDVFTPDLVDDVLARARELETDRPSGQRDRLADELAAVDRELGYLTEAIALGGQVPVLVTRVQETDRRRQELARQIRQLEEAVAPRIDWRAADRHARSVLTEWRALLAEEPSDARPLLRELLAGEPIRFTPIDEPTRRGYRFEGTLVIGGLLEGVVACNGRWRPHRDSNPGFSLERAAS